MIHPDAYKTMSQQPGFMGVNQLDLPIWQSGYGPGTPNWQTDKPQPLTPPPSTTGGQRTSPTAPRPGMSPGRQSSTAYDPVKLMEESWKKQQAQMQQIQQQNQQREQMMQQRRQEERYKQMMGMDLNASLRPWNQPNQAGRNPMLAAQAGAGMSMQPFMGSFGGMSSFGGQVGAVNPLGGLPSWSPPPVAPIQMLGVPGRFGQMQTSGQPSHIQAGQFFGTGSREIRQPYYSSLQ